MINLRRDAGLAGDPDQLINCFEEGVALVRECKKALEGATKKVEVLIKSSGGKLETRLFDEVRERLRETSGGDYEAAEGKNG